ECGNAGQDRADADCRFRIRAAKESEPRHRRGVAATSAGHSRHGGAAGVRHRRRMDTAPGQGMMACAPPLLFFGGAAMPTAKQVSVFLENKPGRLARVLRALERQKINVVGLTVMDSHEHSVLRLVADNVPQTAAVLKELGIPHTEAEVLTVELRNQ